MKTFHGTLGTSVTVLLMTLFGCQGANDVTGPGLPASIETTLRDPIAVPGSRVHPVMPSDHRGSTQVTTRPPIPTPRAYPCLVVSGDGEWKNEPCRPCDGVTTGSQPDGFTPKNKPCHNY